MLEIKNIYKTFNAGTVNEKRALKGVNLTLEDGDFVTVIGGNGAGKSTLLNVISNRLLATSGDVLIDGEKSQENDKALSKIFCMSDKNLYPDSFKIKQVFEYTKTYYPNFDMVYALKLCGDYSLNPNKKIKSLSTGYQSIYKIIVALSCNAPIVFF